MKNQKTPPNPALSVIIVTHNALPFLRATLDSLLTQTGVHFEVIVVDNQSQDETLAVLSREYPQITLLKRGTNVGFAAANNLGIKHARAPYLLFLNPDVTFTTPQALSHCLTRLKRDPQLGALGPRVNLVKNHQIDATCHRGFPTPWASFTHFSGLSKLFPTVTFFNHYTKSYLGYDHEHDIDSVGGMFILVSRRAGEAIGWWDEAFDFYGEDLDFCYRLWQQHFRVLYYPKVIVLHHKGATTGMSQSSRAVTTAPAATTRQVKLWSIAAMQLFYDKHYRAQYPTIVTALVHLGIKVLRIVRVGL